MESHARAQLEDALAAARSAARDDQQPYLDEALEHLGGDVPRPAAPGDPLELARLIDHTQLKPQATAEDVRALCEEARQYGFAAVCVSPCHVAVASEQLASSAVRVCTVVGFPSGATLSSVKAFEAQEVLDAGAEELDMVLPVGRLRGGDYGAVEKDIRGVVEASGGEALVKVILETILLSDVEKAVACVAARRARADFVKTSTGFAGGGATTADVALMRQIVGDALGVKASGGVRTVEDARAMLEAGATRIGASGSVALVEGAEAAAGY